MDGWTVAYKVVEKTNGKLQSMVNGYGSITYVPNEWVEPICKRSNTYLFVFDNEHNAIKYYSRMSKYLISTQVWKCEVDDVITNAPKLMINPYRVEEFWDTIAKFKKENKEIKYDKRILGIFEMPTGTIFAKRVKLLELVRTT